MVCSKGGGAALKNDTSKTMQEPSLLKFNEKILAENDCFFFWKYTVTKFLVLNAFGSKKSR